LAFCSWLEARSCKPPRAGSPACEHIALHQHNSQLNTHNFFLSILQRRDIGRADDPDRALVRLAVLGHERGFERLARGELPREEIIDIINQRIAIDECDTVPALKD
jgi:hypothetical protein